MKYSGVADARYEEPLIDLKSKEGDAEYMAARDLAGLKIGVPVRLGRVSAEPGKTRTLYVMFCPKCETGRVHATMAAANERNGRVCCDDPECGYSADTKQRQFPSLSEICSIALMSVGVIVIAIVASAICSFTPLLNLLELWLRERRMQEEQGAFSWA